MMFDASKLCRQLRFQQIELEAWIEAGWLRPTRAGSEWRFSTIDLLRAQFILDLRDLMGVNDEGVAVILDLLDQIHGLRHALQVVVSINDRKASPRAPEGDKAPSPLNAPSDRASRRGRHGRVAV